MNRKNAIIVGFSIVVIAMIISLIKGDLEVARQITGLTAIITIGLSAILTGALNGLSTRSDVVNNQRRVMVNESRSERNDRYRVSGFFFLIGLPNLVAFILIMYSL